jgi:hypothetical protein
MRARILNILCTYIYLVSAKGIFFAEFLSALAHMQLPRLAHRHLLLQLGEGLQRLQPLSGLDAKWRTEIVHQKFSVGMSTIWRKLLFVVHKSRLENLTQLQQQKILCEFQGFFSTNIWDRI